MTFKRTLILKKYELKSYETILFFPQIPVPIINYIFEFLRWNQPDISKRNAREMLKN